MVPGLTTAVWVGYPKTTASMYNVPPWGEMFGGQAPTAIWHDFMSTVVKNCKSWPAPKEPFVSQPFFGRYSTGTASTGYGTDNSYSGGTGYVPPATNTTPSTGTGTGTTGAGGQKYPPDQYASPPQGAPTTQTPPANGGGTPAPQGNGNGNG
jgi:penicillin-binding protein 1A